MSPRTRTVARAVLMVAVLALALLHVVPVMANHSTIQPGARVSTTLGGCTLNFVFDGTGDLAGRTFIGTAAHCVESEGDAVAIGGHRNAGTVFYLGDTPGSLNGDGRGDNGYPGHQLDFALIDITDNPSPVVPDVKGHTGSPTGSTTRTDTSLGDQVHLSGYGVGFSLTKQTREMRSGLHGGDNERTFFAYAPAISGDSGGPVLHDSGKALGVVSAIGAYGVTGPTVEGVLDELAGLGIHVDLRTA